MRNEPLAMTPAPASNPLQKTALMRRAEIYWRRLATMAQSCCLARFAVK